MTYLSEAVARARAGQSESAYDFLHNVSLGVEQALSDLRDRFDIFLSHSIRDAQLVLGVKRILEDAGKSVYVDWVIDPQLDRNSITGETAKTLRERMAKCEACFYLHSVHSKHSRWMPWELGYFDGSNGNVAILPLISSSGEPSFVNEEYLEIYPKIDFTNLHERPSIYVNRSRRMEPGEFKRFDDWRTGTDKLRPNAS